MEINAKSRLKTSEAADKAKAIVKLCNNSLFKDIRAYTDLAKPNCRSYGDLAYLLKRIDMVLKTDKLSYKSLITAVRSYSKLSEKEKLALEELDLNDLKQQLLDID